MRKLYLLLILCSVSAFAQVAPPQINLSGNIGAQGFPVLNSGMLQFTSDANHTMTAQESSATGGIKVTSTVSLTATRNLILPSGNFQFIAVENATTGGQSIQVIGQSGTGVTIANGASATVWFDGTNVVQTGSSSSSGPILQTNGTNNGSQTTLNLVSGTGATVTNSGANVTISASGSGSTGAQGTVQVAGSTSGAFQASTPAYVATSLLSPALNNFRTALLNSSPFPGTPTTNTNVLLIGTSITCCIGPANYLDSPGSQIKSTLQQFGSNGTGIIPVGDNGTTSTRPEWTLAGTWATVPDLGPNQTNSSATFNSMFVASGNGAGNTLTLTAESGDTLLLYAETTTDSGGCSVSVDGGSPGTFANTTSGSPTMTVTSFSPGAGSHTIVVQPSGAGKCYFYGAQWRYSNTSGIVLNNVAHGYATTNAYCVNPSTQMAMVPLLTPAPSFAIIELGVNEIVEGTMSQATYSSQMQACITYLRGINPNMSILLLDDYNINPTSIGTGITYAQVRATEQALATANNAAYMSIGDSWGTYAQANALGLMASDGLHPSNIGGVNYGALVASYITLGINNLPLNTIKPFIIQQPYLSDISQYPLWTANHSTPSTSTLTSGMKLYDSGPTADYTLGVDLGINTVTGDYGVRLYNNQGAASSSTDVMFQHYINTAGYPTGQGASKGWIQDGYVESSDQSLHMVGSITGSTINGLTGFQLNSAAPSGHCLLGNGTKYVDSASCGGGVVTSLTTTGSSGAATLTSGVLNIPTPTNASALTSGTLADALLSSNVPLLNASNTFTGTTQTMPNLYASVTAEFGPLVGPSHQVVINPAVAITGYNSSDVPMYVFSNIDGSASFAGQLQVPSVKVTGPGIPLATGTTSNTDLAGQITLSTGAGSYTFTATYATAPIVVCTDTTAVALVQCSASTTAITITGTASDVINYIVVGRT